jgi:beta-phosphoglucomutase-like phosphatase (HAD superfamily)
MSNDQPDPPDLDPWSPIIRRPRQAVLEHHPSRPPRRANLLEEAHAPRLSAQEESATRRLRNNLAHQLAADALPLIRRIHEDLRHRGEQVAVGQQPHRAHQSVLSHAPMLIVVAIALATCSAS